MTEKLESCQSRNPFTSDYRHALPALSPLRGKEFAGLQNLM